MFIKRSRRSGSVSKSAVALCVLGLTAGISCTHSVVLVPRPDFQCPSQEDGRWLAGRVKVQTREDWDHTRPFLDATAFCLEASE